MHELLNAFLDYALSGQYALPAFLAVAVLVAVGLWELADWVRRG